MRAQLLHLSGPLRGRTIVYPQDRIRIGRAAGAEVLLDDPAVADHHAEINFVEEGCGHYLKAVDGNVFVNRKQVREVILEPQDLVEIGTGGPKFRFRSLVDPGRPCKPMRQMLSDAAEVRGASGLLASGHALRRDLLSHSSLAVRLGMLGGALAIALGAAFLGGVVGTTQTVRQQEAAQRQLVGTYERELAGLRQQLERFRREQDAYVSRAEVLTLREEMTSRAAAVDAMLARNEALRTVLNVYTRGVCLIHGVYAFMADQGGTLVAITGSDGRPLETEYLGSGFLATTDGHVLTNRHVAEPWWNNDTVAPLLAQGLVPQIVSLTATFPGQAPVAVDPATIVISPDNVDVALMRVTVSNVPVLPLLSDSAESFRGGRVVLLGYPTGLNAILARCEPNLVDRVLARATDTATLIAELARRDAIQPVITQGALNEVRPRRLVYDAETTSGGSGGPVFGPDGTVIGINFAVTRDFGGTNFGVPVRFAQRLLPP